MPAPPLDVRPLRDRIASLGIDALDFDAANEAIERAGLGDGLPVVPPTAARIEAMLATGAIEASGDFGMLMPSFVAPTAWDVAACAVMAGARPGYLPVIAAALRAVAEPEFNLLGVQT
ncbi:MAG: thioredoxin, partial [Chloroflexi bacterium]|nr:thioredoxin [Chloroflexota bacterium]